MPRRARIQVELSADKLEALEALKAVGGFATNADLVNNGLTLLKWALYQARRGHAIAAIDNNSAQYVELEMPCLAFVRSSRSTSHQLVGSITQNLNRLQNDPLTRAAGEAIKRLCRRYGYMS